MTKTFGDMHPELTSRSRRPLLLGAGPAGLGDVEARADVIVEMNNPGVGAASVASD
jgi:hypothetical protein